MMLKDGLFWILGAGASLGQRGVILMYHSIAERPGHFNSVAPRIFAQQMEHLAARSYDVISLTELVRRLQARESLAGAVSITFDDGYRNNFTEAFPILKEKGFPATIFVATDRIGTWEYLSRDDLAALRESGLIDIGSHTKSHPKLDQVALDAVEEEVRVSKQIVEQIAGGPATLFAYPYGRFSDGIVEIVREAGFDAAVTVREGTVGPESDIFRLPRVSIDASTSRIQFRGKISRAMDRYGTIRAFGKALAMQGETVGRAFLDATCGANAPHPTGVLSIASVR